MKKMKKMYKNILNILFFPFQCLNWLLSNTHISFKDYMSAVRTKVKTGKYPGNYTLY